MLRKNSRLRQFLGDAGVKFLEYACGAFERILPHVQVSSWAEAVWSKPRSVWDSPKRTAIRITLAIGNELDGQSRSLQAIVERRSVPGSASAARLTLDDRERDICERIAERISEILRNRYLGEGDASIRAIQSGFDEFIVAKHIETYHGLTKMSVTSIFDALHKLSEESYENKALTFGCILEPRKKAAKKTKQFPGDFLGLKKYKALSDGFRTAYDISADGKIIDFVDLEGFETRELTEKHHYPDWSEPIARASRDLRCSITLSRQGDVLVFEEGTLRFTYRYGRWQYWNHAHLLHLLRARARAQRVPTKILGRVVGAIYRAALDVSFRRSGGLFVILHNRNHLHRIVRRGDAIGDPRRRPVDGEFDDVIREHNLQSLRRVVIVELASLDGESCWTTPVESARTEQYSALRGQAKPGDRRKSQKAAIGASKYG